jgi:drug/metabolite transporter (DMT)-like permease
MEGAGGVARAGQVRSNRAARLAMLHLTLGICAISLTPVLFRFSELGPTATAFYRTFFAIPFLAVWTVVQRRRAAQKRTALAAVRSADAWVLALGGAVFAANMGTYAWAVHLTSIANASLLSNLSPILVSLGSFLVFGERVSRGFVAAMAAAIVGVGILASDKLGIDAAHFLGDGLGVLSSLAFAAYLMILGWLRLRLASSTVMLWTACVSSVFLCAGAVLGGQSLLPATVVGWTILVGLAFVSYAVGQGLLTVALAHVGPTFSAVSLLVLPVTAALYGWLIFSEALTLNWAIGATIVLASILAARLAALPAASPGPR